MSDKEKNNIQVVEKVFQAVNTGDMSKVSDFISPKYFNHESQRDPVRSKMRGPEEFIDTVINLRKAIADLSYEEQETIVCNNKVVYLLYGVYAKRIRTRQSRRNFAESSPNLQKPD